MSLERITLPCEQSCQRYLEDHVYPYVDDIEAQNERLRSEVRQLRADTAQLQRTVAHREGEREHAPPQADLPPTDRRFRRIEADVNGLRLDSLDLQERANRTLSGISKKQDDTLRAIKDVAAAAEVYQKTMSSCFDALGQHAADAARSLEDQTIRSVPHSPVGTDTAIPGSKENLGAALMHEENAALRQKLAAVSRLLKIAGKGLLGRTPSKRRSNQSESKGASVP